MKCFALILETEELHSPDSNPTGLYTFIFSYMYFLRTVYFMRCIVRLMGSSSSRSGRVEVNVGKSLCIPGFNTKSAFLCVGGEWGLVCHDGWSENAAFVVCKQLGYPGYVTALRGSIFSGTFDLPIWMTVQECKGHESELQVQHYPYIYIYIHICMACHQCQNICDSVM